MDELMGGWMDLGYMRGGHIHTYKYPMPFPSSGAKLF